VAREVTEPERVTVWFERAVKNPRVVVATGHPLSHQRYLHALGVGLTEVAYRRSDLKRCRSAVIAGGDANHAPLHLQKTIDGCGRMRSINGTADPMYPCAARQCSRLGLYHEQLLRPARPLVSSTSDAIRRFVLPRQSPASDRRQRVSGAVEPLPFTLGARPVCER